MTLSDVIDTLQTWIRNADDEYDREEMGRVAGLKEALHEIKRIEPCEDAISRQAALDALESIGSLDTEADKKYARSVFEALPSVIPQPKMSNSENLNKWISISERLPEIKQHVLLSCYGRVIYGRMINEDGNSGYPVFEICDSVGEKRPIVLETTVHSEYTTSRIIAWMPLPKPYKAESEVNNG